MKALYAAIAFLAGAGMAIQVGCNSHLRAKLGHPLPAAVTNFVVGLVVVLAMGIVWTPPLPKGQGWSWGPWWVWGGGLIGAVYVITSSAFASRLGAVGWLGAIVTGQVVTSLVLDHFGMLGFPVRPIDGMRLVGAVLLLVGVAMVLKT